MLKGKKGFTLVELLVVIAIVAILAAVAVPTAMSIVEKGHKSNYEAIRDALTTHIKDNAPLEGYLSADDAVNACKLDKKNEFIDTITITVDNNDTTTLVFTLLADSKYKATGDELITKIHNTQVVKEGDTLVLTHSGDTEFTGVLTPAIP